MIPSLRQYLSISIVGMTLLLLALLYFHTRLNQDYLQYHLDTHNKNLAIVLRNSLLADGLGEIMTNEGKALSEPTRAAIFSTLEKQLRWVPVVKVKIYNQDTMVLFSTKMSEIGNSAKENEAVLSALNGLSVSGLVHPNHLNEFDKVIELQDIHQQYIPIKNPRTAEVIGAFEIYTDISDIVGNLDSKRETMFWSIAAILAAFYLALAASFLGIVKLMRNEARQRQVHLGELRAIHEDLERRVEERTAELIESEERLQAIMDNVPEAILTCNSDCVIESINPAALRLFEGKESELTGKNLNDFLTDDSDIDILKHQTTVQREAILRRADESEFNADLWIGPLGHADDTTGYIAVIRDITRRIQAQQELEATRQQYFHQEKMAAIGQLAAGIIHEVGNPISAIAGAASELKSVEICDMLSTEECPFGDAINRNIQVIDEQTTRLGKITREIADFASPKPRERELIDLNGLLQSTTRVLTYDQRFRSIQLDLQLDKDLPAIVAVADQLTQVFMNLLINAMDACSSNNEEKDRILLRSQKEGDNVHVYIEDNGCGMSKEILLRVMEPFYTTKPVGKGSGLGLSLCETIVHANGGKLDIETEEGKGTTVHIYLPIDLNTEDPGSVESGNNEEKV